MKVQTNSKSEPKFPKGDDSKLFYFLSHKRGDLVQISLKPEPEEKKRQLKEKEKNRAEKKGEGHDRELSDLKPSVLILIFCK